jgi:glycogen synthase
LFGIVSRLAAQKGFDLLTDTLPKLLQTHDVRLAVVGTGDARYEKFLQASPRNIRAARGFSAVTMKPGALDRRRE